MLCQKCPYSEFFWSAFCRIRTEYGEIITPYCVQMLENMDQKNSENEFFSRSVLQPNFLSWIFFMPSFTKFYLTSLLDTIIRKTTLHKQCTTSITLSPLQIESKKMACKIYIALLRNLFQIYFSWFVRFPYFPCSLDATNTSF